MANIFSGSEIAGLGVEIEKNGRDFYDTVFSVSKNDAVKKLFKYLSGEEEKHIATFEKILAAAEKYEPAESYTGEYMSYMKALASECVFTKKNKGREIAKKIK